MSTPLTTIYFCTGVLLDSRYQHTIYFDSVAEQREYFAGKVGTNATFPANSYHRRSWELKINTDIENARLWNYAFVENPGEKTIYYFVNKVEYVNDATVKITLELDVMQTNIIEIKNGLLPCFVERQHTVTDVVGDNTVPESLEIGTYYNYHTFDLEALKEMGILVMSTIDLTELYDVDDTKTAYARNFNGVYSGLGVYGFNDIKKLEAQLEKLDTAGKADAVTAIWMYPKSMIRLYDAFDNDEEYSWADFPWGQQYCANVKGVDPKGVNLAGYTNYNDKIFQGYTPKNNKVYTYPYNLLYCTGNQGGKAEYRFEYFHDNGNLYPFMMYGAISPDVGVKIAPDLYNSFGGNSNYDEGLALGNYPPCAWDSDTYKVWLAQNYNQLQHGMESTVGSALLGLGMIVAGAVGTAATGGLGAAAGVGAIGAGISTLYGAHNQISGIMAQKEDAKAQPPQAKGAISTTVNVANGKQTFSFYYKCLRAEQARQIDDYFTMFGYRINRVQTPNIKARPVYTYVKTAGCLIRGNMSNEDIVTIERIFDNGVTFWTFGDWIGFYDQNNKPHQT